MELIEMHRKTLTPVHVLPMVVGALLALAALFAAGTPLTHGTLPRDAVEHLGGP